MLAVAKLMARFSDGVEETKELKKHS